MKKRDRLVKIYSGTETTVLLLQELLEETGILSAIQNNYKSGVEIGHVGSVMSDVDIYIKESDLEKAEPLISDFITRNRS